MTKQKIVGIKRVNFTKDKDEIKGFSVYLATAIPKDYGEGFEVDKVFVSDKKVENISSKLNVNSTVSVVYNKYGKIEDIEDIEEK